MKKILLIIAFISVSIFSSCEGPQGPPGPQGANGSTVEAEVVQISNVDFTAAGSYGIFVNLAILPSDMVLVYRQSGVDGGNPVWQIIPKTYYPTEGEVDFNYDFTQNDVNIYLESTYDLALTPQFTQDQNFRIVIIPGYFSKKALKVENYDSVIEALNLQHAPIREL
ncbi:MAG TPA: hypothetical protein VGB43_05660 [Flavobacterium sp.]